jgi:pimeloyl-ACP methyl ester carboxylesterase
LSKAFTRATLDVMAKTTPTTFVAVLVCALVACGGPAPVAPETKGAAGTIDRRFDVGGHELFLHCEGSGTPTVVFLHGLWQQSDVGDTPEKYFQGLGRSVGERTRWCLHHRANVGKSSQVAQPRTAADSVRELRALLAAAAIDGPLLLVGGSFGGLIAIMYAATHPGDVHGMVLLDATLPTDGDVDLLIPQPDRAQVLAELDQNAERMQVTASGDQAKALLGKLPDVPVVYLAATAEPDFPAHWPAAAMKDRTRQNREDFIALFPRGRVVPVESGHLIPDAPAAEQILGML